MSARTANARDRTFAFALVSPRQRRGPYVRWSIDSTSADFLFARNRSRTALADLAVGDDEACMARCIRSWRAFSSMEDWIAPIIAPSPLSPSSSWSSVVVVASISVDALHAP